MADRGGRGDLLQVVRGNPSPSGHFKWPTPDASVANLGEGTETWLARREREKLKGQNGNGMGMPLTIAVQMWPTPTTQDASNDGGPSQFERNSLPLNAAVKTFPTPTSSNRDSAGGSNSRAKQKKDGTYISGQLNPTWVEWLMGFPLGWTDCDPSATVSSRRSRSGSADASLTTKQED